jgi:hypothetical protein
MITERNIINALIIGATVILAPFVISSALTFDYYPLMACAGVVLLAIAFFVLKEKLSILPLLGSSIAGALNFLPLPLGAVHIFCLLLIFYYVTGYIIIKQKRVTVGKPKLFWPIFILTAIVVYHNHSLNIKAVGGGNTEGGKPAILLLLVVVAYFCSINVASPSVKLLARIPLYAVLLTAISNIPYFLSTAFPSLAPYLYIISNNVNVNAYISSQADASTQVEGIGRLGAFGPLGLAIQLYLICHYPIITWLRPGRWWVLGLSLVSVVFVLASGFRNIIFSFALISLVGVWCYYKWRSLFFVGTGFSILFLLLIASSDGLIDLHERKLPLIAQRTLSFLPGDWDQAALDSAGSSNEFREDIQDVYVKEYLWNSPWIGNGFDINTKQYDTLNAMFESHAGVVDPGYLQAKTFIEGKLFHTGWVSLYDNVGIIGSIAFVILGINEIWLAARLVFGPKADRRSLLFPLYVWLLCNIILTLVAFFFVFGDFGSTFPLFCLYGMALSHLYDIEAKSADVTAVLVDGKKPTDFSHLRSALKGYPSKSLG